MKTNFLPQLQMDLYGAMGDDGSSLPMKLYTEEQVKEAYLEGWNDGQNDNIGYIDRVINSLTPIELPSDEEVLEECNKLPFEKHVDCGLYNDGQIDGFELGAKWMKEQILNQNK